MTTEISVVEVTQRLAEGAVLVDVREDDEWLAGHAPDALHLPMSRIGGHLDQLPTDRQILCICHIGGRSAAVAHALRNAGYDALNVTGGMEDWQAAGLPVVV